MDGSVDRTVARGWLDHLRRRTPLGPMRLALEGERRIFLDAIQHTHTDNGRSNGWMLLATMGEVGIGPNVGTVANLAGFVLADRRALTDNANGLFAELIDGSETTRAHRLAGPFDRDQALTELDWRFLELKLLLQALDKAIDNTDLIAIEGFRSEHGRLPRWLDELVPGWLDAVPDDPFSAGGCVYRPVPLDQLGRDFLLYIVVPTDRMTAARRVRSDRMRRSRSVVSAG